MQVFPHTIACKAATDIGDDIIASHASSHRAINNLLIQCEMFDDLKTPAKVGLLRESSRPQTETVLHIVLKFQFDHSCFQGRKPAANLRGKVE